jgi:hypothetical protein
MNFLPTENIIYKTRLKEADVVKRLGDIVEPEKGYRFGFGTGSTRQYEGQINGQMFNIKRIIGYRNSFLPRINGTIEKNYDGTTIKVKMQLHILIVVFLCVWCGGFGLAGIAILTQAFRSSEFNAMTLIPVGMLIFVYGLTMGGFKFESVRSKKDLQAIFEADIFED